MEITPAQFAQIEDCLPKRFGNWYTIYTRRAVGPSPACSIAFEQLQQAQVVQVKIEAVSQPSG